MKASIKVTQAPDFTAVDIDKVIAPILARYEKLAEDAIKAEWPVATGKSKAAWKVEGIVVEHKAKLVFSNDVDYTQYVAKNRGSPLSPTLIAKILADLTPKMDAEIGRAIQKAMSDAPVRRR